MEAKAMILDTVKESALPFKPFVHCCSKPVTERATRLLETGDYSDMTITCGSDTHRLHKVIVAKRSEFFARALNFGGQETAHNKIDLKDDKPETVKLLIQYLYEGDYDPLLPVYGRGDVVLRHRSNCKHQNWWAYAFPHTCDIEDEFSCRICPHHICGYDCLYECKGFVCEKCTKVGLAPLNGDSTQLILHTQMYEIADKYGVVGLKDLAMEKFSRACKHFWDSRYFPVAALHAFTSTPDKDEGLRDLVSRTISEHLELLLKGEIKAMLHKFNGLSYGILKDKLQKHEWAKLTRWDQEAKDYD